MFLDYRKKKKVENRESKLYMKKLECVRRGSVEGK